MSNRTMATTWLAVLAVTVPATVAAACPRLADGDRYSRLNEILDCIEARIDAAPASTAALPASQPAASGTVVENAFVRANVRARRDAEGNLELTLELVNITAADMLLAVEGGTAVAADETGASDDADQLKGVDAMRVGTNRPDMFSLVSPGAKKVIGVVFRANRGGRNVGGQVLSFGITMLAFDDTAQRAKQLFSLGFDGIPVAGPGDR